MQFLKTSASKISRISAFTGSTLVLVMVGILLIFYLVSLQVSEHFKSQFAVQLMLKSEATEAEVMAYKKDIEGSGIASSVTYISSDEAARSYQEEIGEPFVDVMGSNPIPASLDVKIHPDKFSPENVDTFVAQAQQNPLISDVVYIKSLLQVVNENIEKWGTVVGVIVLVFLLISALIIMNTVELAISSQRYIIRSMQLVGATPGFIRKPFIWHSIKNAVASALVAWMLIVGTLFLFRDSLSEIIQVLMDGQGFWKLGILIVSLSVLVGALSTWLTVNRFIRAKVNQMV